MGISTGMLIIHMFIYGHNTPMSLQALSTGTLLVLRFLCRSQLPGKTLDSATAVGVPRCKLLAFLEENEKFSLCSRTAHEHKHGLAVDGEFWNRFVKKGGVQLQNQKGL